MAEPDRNRIAALIRRWRAFEKTHAQTARELRGRIQNACEALTTSVDYRQMLTTDTVRNLYQAASPYAKDLGFSANSDKEFFFWGTTMCLFLTAQ